MENRTGRSFTLKKILIPLLFIVFIILSGYTGYYFGLNSRSNASLPLSGQKANTGSSAINTTAEKIGPASLIKKQQAVAIGSVVDADYNNITIKASDGKQGKFKLAPNVMIYPLVLPGEKPMLGTRDKNQIKTDQKAAVTLDLINNEYVVTTITYIKN